MFESLFTYYNQYSQSFKRVPSGSLEAFLKEPWHYYRPNESNSMYARNTLTFDLGGDKDRPATDEAYAQTFLAEVDQVFSLVLIAEYFDESLVLLRHLLSWDLDDILYVKLNMRTQSSKQRLTPDLPAKIRAWNSLDARLYDHFNASLWRQLSALGPDCVAREVRLLRQAQEKLMRSCFGGGMPLLRSAAEIKNKNLRPSQPKQVKILGYDIPANFSSGLSSQDQKLCLKLIMPEVQYTRMLLDSQSQRYQRSHQLQPPLWSYTLRQPICTVLLQCPQVQHSQPPPEKWATTNAKSAVGTEGQNTNLRPKVLKKTSPHRLKKGQHILCAYQAVLLWFMGVQNRGLLWEKSGLFFNQCLSCPFQTVCNKNKCVKREGRVLVTSELESLSSVVCQQVSGLADKG